MSDDAIGGLIVVGLLFAILPIVIVLLLLWFIFENQEEIGAALAEIGKGIWKAHKYAGYALLWLARDLPVLLLATDEWGSRGVRAAIIFWLVILPPLLFIGLWFAVAGLFAEQTLVLVLTAPSMAAIAYGYYTGYFERPVRHHRWPRFMAAFYLMRAEGQLTFIEWSMRARLWMLQKQQMVQSLVVEDK